MRKLIAFILLFCMIFSCVSCDDDISTTSSNQNDESAPESSVSESASEESSSGESEIEESASSSTELESVEASESESVEVSSSESDEEESESSETEVIAPVTFGNYSSVTSGVSQSYDRLRQMVASKNAYGKGATCSDAEIESILRGASTIRLGGSFFSSYKNAGKLIGHFLDNSGEDYDIDMDEFLKDTNALKTRNDELNDALRACEALAIEGEKINVYQKEEIVHHNLSGDWWYAVGSYFTSIEIIDLSVSGNVYSATVKYNVTDFYNWDFNNDTSVFSGFLGSLTNNISPKDLHQLHRAGKAQEFLSHGEVTYTFSWIKGSTVDTIPALNR